jgi:hypothetical protein
VFSVDEVQFVNEINPSGKEIKIKQTTQNMNDMRHMLYIGLQNRTFVFSAHNRADQRMWLQAFEIYFELKQIAECIKKNIPIPERILKKRKDYVDPKAEKPKHKSLLA